MLKIKNLTGGYSRLAVLKDISFDIKDGEFLGLIGLNGAGKSTTINEIVGLLTPFSGTITIDDLSLDKDQAAYQKKIGFIPETPVLYDELTLKEHIETVAMAYDIPVETALSRANRFLKLFRLENKLDWFPTRFSKGMKQKVMITCALMIEPRLLIVDEPFLGLDPIAIQDFKDLLREEKEKGTSILMTTHILDSAEKMCDRFVVLHKGEVSSFGDLQTLRHDFGKEKASLNEIYLGLTHKGDVDESTV